MKTKADGGSFVPYSYLQNLGSFSTTETRVILFSSSELSHWWCSYFARKILECYFYGTREEITHEKKVYKHLVVVWVVTGKWSPKSASLSLRHFQKNGTDTILCPNLSSTTARHLPSCLPHHRNNTSDIHHPNQRTVRHKRLSSAIVGSAPEVRTHLRIALSPGRTDNIITSTVKIISL